MNAVAVCRLILSTMGGGKTDARVPRVRVNLVEDQPATRSLVAHTTAHVRWVSVLAQYQKYRQPKAQGSPGSFPTQKRKKDLLS